MGRQFVTLLVVCSLLSGCGMGKSVSRTLHDQSGSRYLHEGKYKEAAEQFRQAVDSDPNSATAHSNLGLALYDEGRYQESEKELREAIKLKPDMRQAHVNLSLVLRHQGMLDDSIAEARKGTELDSKDANAWGSLGASLLDKKQYSEARSALEKAVAIDPGLPNLKLNLGMAHAHMGDLKGAETLCREEVRANSRSAVAYADLALVQFAQGKYQDSFDAAVDGLRVAPKSSKLLDSAGAAAYSLGKLSDAEGYVRKALKVEPRNEAAQVNLGKILIAEKRFPEARAVLDHIPINSTYRKLANQTLDTIPGN